MSTTLRSPKKTARLTGLVYLIWIITGLYGLLYVPSKIFVRGDAAATASNILSNEFLFRTYIMNDLISSALWIILVMLLYRLFKGVNERQARLLVGFVLVQVPVSFILGAFDIASLMTLKGEILTSFDPAQRQDLAMLFLRMNDYGVLTLELFWGLWLFPLAILVYTSRFLPRFLGVWLTINGLACLAMSFSALLVPQFKDVVSNITMPALFGEVAFMLWILIMGVKDRTAAAPAS